tara:strand:+ start:182 stop:457 length:276 start_codon:yes stop_codon:yes gene_type:complete
MYKSLRRTDEERAAAFAEIDRLRAEQQMEIDKSDKRCTMGLAFYLVATILAYNFAPIGLAILVLFAPAIGFAVMTVGMVILDIIEPSSKRI